MIFATIQTKCSKHFLFNDGETTYNCVALVSRDETERSFRDFLNMLGEYGYQVHIKEL